MKKEKNDSTEKELQENPEKCTEEVTPEIPKPEENPWQNQFIRLAADFENYKKHAKTEKDACYINAKVDAVATLLPIIDNLERALAAAADDSPLKQGVEMILQQTTQAFETLGVTAVGQEGEPFDPEIHNAVLHCEDETLEANVIAQVLQKGYRLGDRMIRHAMVKVAN